MSPERGRAAKIGEGRQSTPDSAPASETEIALTNDHEEVPDQQPFRLMDLPLELRTMIFKHFLVMPGPVLFRSTGWKQLAPFAELGSVGSAANHRRPYNDLMGLDESSKIRQGGLLNLFSASKTIFRETVPLYFGCNQFDFQTLDCMKNFISKVGAEYRWQITSITVGYFGRAPVKAIKRLNECVGLRELTLYNDCFSLAPFYSDKLPEVSLAGMRDLLRIRGLDKIDVVMDDQEWFFGYTPPPGSIIDGLKKQLEVLTKPRDPRQLTRQEKKDFPTNAKRTVFGAANVVTRSEKKMQDRKH